MKGGAGGALVVQGDALHLPLADESVDLIVTSPPYWQLRDYDTPGQVGSEPDPAAFLEALWAAAAECKRVLKPGGSMFFNLGDTYAARANDGPSSHPGSSDGVFSRAERPRRPKRFGTVREKSLHGLPWAFTLGCTGMLASLGGPDPGLDLIWRAEIIWQKVNGLPESVRDRVRRSHEVVLHFTKSPRYYSAVDEVREPHAEVSLRRAQPHRADPGRSWQEGAPYGDLAPPQTLRLDQMNHPLGKLPGSVWAIPSEPLRLPDWLGVQHYAAFPSELPRRIILGWSPPGICLACGEGRWPVVDRKPMVWRESPTIVGRTQPNGSRRPASGTQLEPAEATILGYACACTPSTLHPGTSGYDGQQVPYREHLASGSYPPNFGAGSGTHDNLSARPKVGPWREYRLIGWTAPPTKPAVVLDPFSGTGTTVGVARQLGRIGVGFDLSHAYCRAARYRVFQSGDFGKAEGRTWAERQVSLL